MAFTSPPQRVPPQQLPTATRGTLKVLVAVGVILLVTVLPLSKLYVLAVTLVAFRLLLPPN